MVLLAVVKPQLTVVQVGKCRRHQVLPVMSAVVVVGVQSAVAATRLNQHLLLLLRMVSSDVDRKLNLLLRPV